MVEWKSTDLVLWLTKLKEQILKKGGEGFLILELTE